MTGNPILNRELLQQFRSTKLLIAILAVAVVSGGLVLLRWPAESSADVMNRRSMEVFRPLTYALAAAVTLLVPAFPAASIVRERSQRTLPMLLHAPISALTIYSGKFLGNVLLAAVLLSATLPAMAASYAMGGISLSQQVVPLYLLLIGMACQFTAVALWISSRAATAEESLRWSYATVLVLAVITLGPAMFIASGSGPLSTVAEWLQKLSPVLPLQTILGDSLAIQSPIMAVGIYLLATLLVVVLTAYATLKRLHPNASERARKMSVVTDDQGTSTKVLRRLTFLVDPNRRKSGIPRFVNPLMVKEFRTRRFGRFHWLLRLVAGCAVAS
ncbi:MAG: ABC transporter permease, partial [Planctomycetota bacterium]